MMEKLVMQAGASRASKTGAGGEPNPDGANCCSAEQDQGAFLLTHARR